MSIPMIIHYCWFGPKELDPLSKSCLESWKRHLSHYDFQLWNESNVDISRSRYMKRAYEKKKWAFVADYARLDALYNHGGIYLDTDMEIIRPIDPLHGYEAFAGEEADGQISAGIIGAKKGHEFIKLCLDFMDDYRGYEVDNWLTLPKIMQSHLGKFKDRLKILPAEYFYPYNPWAQQSGVKQLMYCNITPSTYAIHHWAGSWIEPTSCHRHTRSILRKFSTRLLRW